MSLLSTGSISLDTVDCTFKRDILARFRSLYLSMNRLLVLVFDKNFLRNATNGLHVERVSITEDIFSENLQLWSNVLEESARYNLIFADFILIISFNVNSTYCIAPVV